MLRTAVVLTLIDAFRFAARPVPLGKANGSSSSRSDNCRAYRVPARWSRRRHPVRGGRSTSRRWPRPPALRPPCNHLFTFTDASSPWPAGAVRAQAWQGTFNFVPADSTLLAQRGFRRRGAAGAADLPRRLLSAPPPPSPAAAILVYANRPDCRTFRGRTAAATAPRSPAAPCCRRDSSPSSAAP